VIESREPLTDKYSTTDTMRELVNTFSSDLDHIYINDQKASALPLDQFFDYVRKIKYRQDHKPVEVIARPNHILRYSYLGMDCKKKTLLLSSWAKQNKIPFRFIASSKRKDKKIHHIFPQLKINNQWLNVDATYPDYKLGEPKTVTHYEVIS